MELENINIQDSSDFIIGFVWHKLKEGCLQNAMIKNGGCINTNNC